MAKANPKRALARNIEQSVAASRATGKQVALYLSREEWAWVIKALRLAGDVEQQKGVPHEPG